MSPERTPELFDQWADTYDDIIKAWSDSFPFMGYSQILDRMFQLANPKPSMRILDVGIGTGTLAKTFSDIGCETWGIDYSRKMLELAEEKVPEVKLLQTDIRNEWPRELTPPFDRIVSAYVLHHFGLEEKIRISRRIVEDLLTPKGLFIVGDISFQTQKDFNDNRKKLAHHWDDTEYYWSADLFVEGMSRKGYTVTYEQISFCGGIYSIKGNSDD
ncbi:MAG: class I SAM-dependent DNA methyltransferase [Candidatus Thorarchaeota archaeon]|jgi:putative AdoMet-dependent methyltransferase